MRWSRPIRACHSAGSNDPVTAANLAPKGFESLPTSRRSGFRKDDADCIASSPTVIPSASEGPRPSCIGHPRYHVKSLAYVRSLVVYATRDDVAVLLRTVSTARAD